MPANRFECTPMPQKARCASALGIGVSTVATVLKTFAAIRVSLAIGQVGVEFGILVLVQVELALPGRARLSRG